MQASTARHHAGIAGAEQRRALIRGRKLGEFCDHRSTCVMDRCADSCGMPRTTGNAGVRQIGAAGAERQLVEIETERVGRDLRQRGPGALPHVVRTGLHHALAVGTDHRARIALEHDGRERRGADSPADQEAVLVAHLARLQRTSRPAETLGRPGVALAQRLGGERLAGGRLDLGIVLQPELQRIDAAGERRLVDRAFQHDRSGGLARRAHEQRRAGVDADRLMRG
ncbi:hypothetical protein chiPu_0030808, partial [Chiloscyllium punctatum]|nr:hypothetical protein [Chiloscyllium punctatum]